MGWFPLRPESKDEILKQLELYSVELKAPKPLNAGEIGGTNAAGHKETRFIGVCFPDSLGTDELAMTIYLETLTSRLFLGASRLPAATMERHRRYLLAAQNPDGGFSGREGESDLYYSGFALRGLALLDALSEDVAQRGSSYLQGQMQGQASVVDFLSLLYGALLLQTSAGVDLFENVAEDWPQRVTNRLQELRRDDGGYAKGDRGASSSTYYSFLVVLCFQLVGQSVPQSDRLIEFIRSRQREDGGFVEMEVMRRSGTNPTSAAIALLRILEALDDEVAEAAANYLCDRQSDEGGLQANTQIPVADTLSTFTGLLTLADLGWAEELNLQAVRKFVQSMELPGGGFRGAVLDPFCDVEYTFYGLGTLALLEELQNSPTSS